MFYQYGISILGGGPVSLNHLLQPPGHGLRQVLQVAVVRHPGDPELHNLPLPVLRVCADNVFELQLHL